MISTIKNSIQSKIDELNYKSMTLNELVIYQTQWNQINCFNLKKMNKKFDKILISK